MNDLISFVIPCYRSEKTISDVVEEIVELSNANKYDYEIILVNDSSPDNVWEVIRNICCENQHVRAIKFSKNFGQAAAVMAGYRECSGGLIVTMDDDGQSPVDKLPEMISMMNTNGYDVVYGTCEEAKFSFSRRIGSKVNAWMAYTAYGRPMDKRIVSINVMRRYVVEEIVRYDQPYAYLSGLVYRSTRNIGYCKVEHRSRASGTSGYKLSSLLKIWVNGFTAFSIKPLQMATYIGFMVAAGGFVLGIITIIRKIINHHIATGWSSTISILLFLGGIILLVLGIIGEYIGRIYMCINMSPQYVISEKVNNNK